MVPGPNPQWHSMPPSGVRLIVRIRGHGFARLKAGHADLGGTEPFGGDGGIHGDVSASDDEHVSGQVGLFVAPVGAQELKAPVDAGKLDASMRTLRLTVVPGPA